jgi:hypothetical protein
MFLRDPSTRMWILCPKEQVRGKSELYTEEVKTKLRKRKKKRNEKRGIYFVSSVVINILLEMTTGFQVYIMGPGLCSFCDERYAILNNYSE